MNRRNPPGPRDARVVLETDASDRQAPDGRGGEGASGPDTRRLERLAWWLDSAIRVPGTRFRIGIDGLIGLVPGIGDGVGALLAGYIVAEAARLGVPGSTLARMVLNVAVDTLVGAVPVLGDLFDFAWKANRRNVRLLQDYERDPKRTSRRNLGVVTVVVAVVLVVLAVVAWAAFSIVRWLWLTATGT